MGLSTGMSAYKPHFVVELGFPGLQTNADKKAVTQDVWGLDTPSVSAVMWQ